MKVLPIVLRRIMIAAVTVLLAACSGPDEISALQNHVQSIVNRPQSAMEPLPRLAAHQSFSYSAASLRSPFDLSPDSNTLLRSHTEEVMPDLNRTPELLERFNLGALLMVGTLGKSGQLWALIRDETGAITRVTVGNYMGRNHGRVVNISEAQLDLMELVPTGDGGWVPRPQSLLLQQ
jgi:type IV pilus assembly protein PilP